MWPPRMAPWRSLRRGLVTGIKKPKYKPSNAFDAWCYEWLGIPAMHASRIMVICLGAGFCMETFMVKVWIGQTNCARSGLRHL